MCPCPLVSCVTADRTVGEGVEGADAEGAAAEAAGAEPDDAAAGAGAAFGFGFGLAVFLLDGLAFFLLPGFAFGFWALPVFGSFVVFLFLGGFADFECAVSFDRWDDERLNFVERLARAVAATAIPPAMRPQTSSRALMIKARRERPIWIMAGGRARNEEPVLPHRRPRRILQRLSRSLAKRPGG